MEQAPVSVRDVWAAGPDEAWGVGYHVEGEDFLGAGYGPGPNIVRYDGESWTTAWDSEGGDVYHGVWGAASDDVWAVGGGLGVAIIAHYDGSEWSELDTGLPFPASWTEELHDVGGTGPSDVWAVGSTSSTGSFGALVMHFDGVRWSVVSGPDTTGLIGVHVTSDGVVWTLSRRDGVFRRDGDTWTHFDPGLPLPSGAALARIGEAEGRIWIGGETGIAVFEDGAFVARDAPMAARSRDALLHGDMEVYATFDHERSECDFLHTRCERLVDGQIATVRLRRPSGERALVIDSPGIMGATFFATDEDVWVLGRSYWRIPR